MPSDRDSDRTGDVVWGRPLSTEAADPVYYPEDAERISRGVLQIELYALIALQLWRLLLSRRDDAGRP